MLWLLTVIALVALDWNRPGWSRRLYGKARHMFDSHATPPAPPPASHTPPWRSPPAPPTAATPEPPVTGAPWNPSGGYPPVSNPPPSAADVPGTPPPTTGTGPVETPWRS